MVQTNAKQIWMFQRYHLVMEYKHKPVLVPPFITFNHVFCAIRFLCNRCFPDKWGNPNKEQGDDTNMLSAIYNLETKPNQCSTVLFLVWTIPDRKRENMGTKDGTADEYMHVGNLNFKTSIHL